MLSSSSSAYSNLHKLGYSWINQMYKVHPSTGTCTRTRSLVDDEVPAAWTVWKKCSMAFQGTDGFMAFDGSGRLAFRVDNYSRKRGELLLMDGGGRVLFTLRPQILSMHDRWNGIQGEDGVRTTDKRTATVFSMRRRSMFQSDEVEVFMDNQSWAPRYLVKGSFRRRSCKICCCVTGEVAAEIARKKISNKAATLGDDVFSLTVHPSFNDDLMMAFVIVMDRISSRPFTNLMCN